MVALSKLAFDCGDLEESTLLAAKADELMVNDTWEFDKLVTVWRNLGRFDKALASETKAKKILEANEQRNKEWQAGPFRNVRL